MKDTSKAVKASRKRAGVKPTSFAFTDEEKAEIAAAADALGVSRKEAVLEGVRKLLRQGRLSRAELLRELERRLKE